MLPGTNSFSMKSAAFWAVFLMGFTFLGFPFPLSGQEIGDPLAKYNEAFGSTSGSEAITVLLKVRSSLLSLLKFILLVASLGMLLLSVINMMQGESSAAKRMFMWFLGLGIGFSLIGVVSRFGTYSATSGALQRANDFSSIKMAVGGVLSVLLSIVSMVTLVMVVIHVMKGEKDGFEKLIKWLVVSVAGLSLLNII